MADLRMTDGARQEFDDLIREHRLSARLERRAGRHAFWARVGDALLAMPVGIAMRIGG